ncbi:hypothetical protein [Flavihumibacter solisilvae]|uniref:hypothetical protein n=1 Tax=Flavihumibacter solisilvae TaxID=1349421 RepID=UPI00057FDAB4|nr:hypothetical protein [Flavihumibacter solisilvae]
MELTRTIQFYFRQPSLSGITVSELEKAVSRYPYCGPLHLLLLKKQVQERHPDLQKQFEKTSIYFPNSFLLNELLRAPEAPPKVKPAATLVAEPIAVVAEPTVEPPVPEISAVPEEALASETTSTPPPVFEPQAAETPAKESKEETFRSDILQKESPIRIPTLKDINPQTDEQPLFEPYHTIDYFASQGIKMSANLPANDKLGRQLKSFTDWIKTMKKLPQSTIEKQLLDSGNGERIVAMAAGSVEHREVLTETMAEVLVKQGSIENAISLYRKLSLAHPDKSAYFATRIEQLKNR